MIGGKSDTANVCRVGRCHSNVVETLNTNKRPSQVGSFRIKDEETCPRFFSLFFCNDDDIVVCLILNYCAARYVLCCAVLYQHRTLGYEIGLKALVCACVQCARVYSSA